MTHITGCDHLFALKQALKRLHTTSLCTILILVLTLEGPDKPISCMFPLIQSECSAKCERRLHFSLCHFKAGVNKPR